MDSIPTLQEVMLKLGDLNTQVTMMTKKLENQADKWGNSGYKVPLHVGHHRWWCCIFHVARQRSILIMRIRIELPVKTSQILAYLHEIKGVEGEVWECGVNNGGTSRWVGFTLSGYSSEGGLTPAKTFRLFDSFCGRSPNSPEDEGCSDTPFDGTSIEEVKGLVPWSFVHFHEGYIPDTFKGLEDCKICLAYVDLDLYAPTVASLEFIIPRLSKRGLILVDDYTRPDVWPGAQKAVDEVMSRHPEMRGKVVESSAFAIFHKLHGV